MEELQLKESESCLLTSFYVRSTLCALPASVVQEVIRVGSFTRVRHAADEIAGVINLRGKIVTLLDAGVILGFGKTSVSKESRVFIVEDRGEFLGILVDRVSEVFEVEPDQETKLPVNVPPAQARFFKGVCRAGGHVLALLNPQEVLNESRV